MNTTDLALDLGKKTDLTQKYVKFLFTYSDGNLFWNVSKTNSVKIGDKAGHLDNKGYWRVRVDGKLYLVHRLIFLYHHGYLPGVVDHIDNNPCNNKIDNLRECTVSQNMMNSRIRKDNKSGVKGVSLDKRSNRWCVRIWVQGKYKAFGCYNDIELAELVAQEVRDKYHADYSRCK